MKFRTAMLIVMLLPLTALAEQWTQFRGPDGQGHSSIARLPLKWSATSDNIAWRTPIDGLGWSSPVLQGDRIWLTTATDDGKSLLAVCLASVSGDVIHNIEVFRRDQPLRIHSKNSHASPTPVVEGDRVYVHFGTYGTACLSAEGKILWRNSIEYNHVHGPGGSPVIFEDSLIFSCDGGDQQFVVALDKRSGEVAWKTDRPKTPNGKKFAFSTPLLIEHEGQPQVIVPAAGSVVSYDPRSGEQLWYARYGEGYSVVPRAVFGHGLVFVSSGYDQPVMLAIRVDGRGDVTETHVAWTSDRAAPRNASPLLVGDELYLVNDQGIATCLDAMTGEQHWQERLTGKYSASPLLAAGRIYFLNESGLTTVIKPGTTFKELAQNDVGGQSLASLTPLEGALLLRNDTHLYRIDADGE